ncbi:MAG: hypothetical protein IJ737_05005 [Ruminococcus sp.]|nr:hypothetical protein [Ruminococcus sp.]
MKLKNAFDRIKTPQIWIDEALENAEREKPRLKMHQNAAVIAIACAAVIMLLTMPMLMPRREVPSIEREQEELSPAAGEETAVTTGEGFQEKLLPNSKEAVIAEMSRNYDIVFVGIIVGTSETTSGVEILRTREINKAKGLDETLDYQLGSYIFTQDAVNYTDGHVRKGVSAAAMNKHFGDEVAIGLTVDREKLEQDMHVDPEEYLQDNDAGSWAGSFYMKPGAFANFGATEDKEFNEILDTYRVICYTDEIIRMCLMSNYPYDRAENITVQQGGEFMELSVSRTVPVYPDTDDADAGSYWNALVCTFETREPVKVSSEVTSDADVGKIELGLEKENGEKLKSSIDLRVTGITELNKVEIRAQEGYVSSFNMVIFINTPFGMMAAGDRIRIEAEVPENDHHAIALITAEKENEYAVQPEYLQVYTSGLSPEDMGLEINDELPAVRCEFPVDGAPDPDEVYVNTSYYLGINSGGEQLWSYAQEWNEDKETGAGRSIYFTKSESGREYIFTAQDAAEEAQDSWAALTFSWSKRYKTLLSISGTGDRGAVIKIYEGSLEEYKNGEIDLENGEHMMIYLFG